MQSRIGKTHVLPRYFVALLCLATAFWPSQGEASDWMFRRSYYTHENGNPVQIAGTPPIRQPYRYNTGAYVRAGYRNINSRITVGGRTYDQINAWESWISVGP